MEKKYVIMNPYMPNTYWDAKDQQFRDFYFCTEYETEQEAANAVPQFSIVIILPLYKS